MVIAADDPVPIWDVHTITESHPAYGILLVNKPATITTFDIIRRIKRYRRKIKVGHAGTLDPFATGLVLLAMGRATRRIQDLQNLPKTYEGVIRLGVTTPSLDPDTPIREKKPVPPLSLEVLRRVAASFEGTIMQQPPVYSALKVKGRRAYELARAGSPPVLRPRAVTVHRFAIEKLEGKDVHFILECGKGTYARALARDFAKALQTVGMLYRLVRTRIGPFSVNDAWELSDLETVLQAQPAFLQ